MTVMKKEAVTEWQSGGVESGNYHANNVLIRFSKRVTGRGGWFHFFSPKIVWF